MKSIFLNALLIPVWFSILAASICLYWDFQFRDQARNAEAKFLGLEKTIKAIECPSLNKDAVILVARNQIEQWQRFRDLLRAGVIVFLAIGFINFVLVLRHLKLQPNK